MSYKELNYVITWDEITPCPEMYNDNIGHTSFEVTWVEDTPDSFVSELEDAIVDSYNEETYRIEQEEIAEHKRLKDIDDENSWNGIK